MYLSLPEQFFDGTKTNFRFLFENGKKSHHLVKPRKETRAFHPGSALHFWTVGPDKKERINPELTGTIYWFDALENTQVHYMDLDTDDILLFVPERPMPTGDLCPACYAIEEIEINAARHEIKAGGELLSEILTARLIKREGFTNTNQFYANYPNVGGRPWKGQLLHWGDRLYNPARARIFIPL